jgi:hypothetical protein
MLCFQLFDKNTNRAVSLNQVDEEICALLGEPVDTKAYCPIFKWEDKVSFGTIQHAISWYDTIGLALATGKSYDECRELSDNENVRKILDYLESKYTPTAFYQPK